MYWQLTALGVPCEVVALTLVPTKAADRVKTDRREALKLAWSYRAGDLTAVWVPDAAHDALRVVQIAADGTLDTGFKRDDVSLPTLRTSNADAVGGPVDILHLKPPHVTGPHTIDRGQAQNRCVATLPWRVSGS